jgi:hypothetical protein
MSIEHMARLQIGVLPANRRLPMGENYLQIYAILVIPAPAVKRIYAPSVSNVAFEPTPGVN